MTENITKEWKDITVEDLIRLNYLELKSASKIGGDVWGEWKSSSL